MKMRGLILSILAFTVVTAAVNVSTAEAPEGFHEITYQYAKEVDVPYLDFDLEHLAIIENQRQAHVEAVRAAKAAEVEEVPTEEETAANEPVCLGVWTCTAYCSCPACCGEYATGYTASGTVQTCNKCGSHGVVIDTRTITGGIVKRRRECHKCGYRWNTYEVPAEAVKFKRKGAKNGN